MTLVETRVLSTDPLPNRISLIPPRRFSEDDPELMDAPNPNPDVLRQDLRNLRTINRFFGGYRAVRRHITDLIVRAESNDVIRILDLATGSADHPIGLVRLAHQLGRKIHITAVDRNPVTLSVARERTTQMPEIDVIEGDILQLQYPPQSFDIVLCSLALHHFSRNNAIRILNMMSSVSRIGLIVNDLDRSWLAAWAAWMYTHATSRNPLTLNDSYVSVLRAFTPRELNEMALAASVPHARVYRHPIFRLVLVGEH